MYSQSRTRIPGISYITLETKEWGGIEFVHAPKDVSSSSSIAVELRLPPNAPYRSTHRVVMLWATHTMSGAEKETLMLTFNLNARGWFTGSSCQITFQDGKWRQCRWWQDDTNFTYQIDTTQT
ncbi:hypothetical protein GEMRC1_012200 [Eukaryota sp. GEM-RC1]